MVGIIRYLPYWPLAAARVAVVGGLVRSWRAVGSNPIPLTKSHFLGDSVHYSGSHGGMI